MKMLLLIFLFYGYAAQVLGIDFDEDLKTDINDKISKKCQVVKEAPGGSHLCDIEGFSKKQTINCNTLLNNTKKELGKLPKDALIYALKVLKKNQSSFESKQCYEHSDGPGQDGARFKQTKTRDKFEKQYMKNGIVNKCKVLINNTDQRYTKGQNCMIMSYVVDLCADSKSRKKGRQNFGGGRGTDSHIVKHFPTFFGYGTCKSKYDTKGTFINRAGEGTTLLGAFVTGPQFDYGHQHSSAYRKLRKSIKKAEKRDIGVPAANLWGLNTTNSRASNDNKYLHASPYTSAGCVSIPVKDYKVVTDLASKGPSLIVTYKKGRMEDIDKCSGDEKVRNTKTSFYTGKLSNRYETLNGLVKKRAKKIGRTKAIRSLNSKTRKEYLKIKKLRDRYLKECGDGSC